MTIARETRLLDLALALSRARQLVQQLNQSARWAAGHAPLSQIGIYLVLGLEAYAGDIEMDPIYAVDELVEEGGSFTRTAVAVALVVDVVRPEVGDLLRVVFPKRHAPHAITGYHSCLPYLMENSGLFINH